MGAVGQRIADLAGELQEGRKTMSIMTRRPISHDEAREALHRFENQFWKKDRHTNEWPRIGIPARPDHDDDLVLAAYIEQQRAKG